MPLQQASPIFIVGAPRTGTTLVREILTLHPDVHICDEVHFCERILERFGDLDEIGPDTVHSAARLLLTETKWSGASDDLEASISKLAEAAGPPPVTYASLFRGYLLVEAANHGKTIWGDSSPQDVLYMNILKSWYPDSKFITLIRDPRAYLASYKNYIRKGVSTYVNRYNPIVNSLLWKRYMNAAIMASNGPWKEDVLPVHYENLVDDPESCVRGICQFLSLEYHDEMLQVGRQNSSYIAVQDDYKARGINPLSKERWRKSLTMSEQWVIERTASRPMHQLGYIAEIKTLPLSQWRPLFGMLLHLPVRLFNMSFRSRKPFTLGKLRKVLGKKSS